MPGKKKGATAKAATTKKVSSRCKYCDDKGHKSKECPQLHAGDAKLARFISCMAWIPQGASAQSLMEGDAPMTEEEPAVDGMYESESDSEANFEIKETDYLYIAGKADERKEEYSIYVMVYDYDEDRQFERQDIILSHPPLALSWLDFTPSGEKGSYAAVGTMQPHIEIFDLDKKNDLRAVCTLGGTGSVEDMYMSQTPKQMKKSVVPGSHVGAVLSVDWNINQRNLLATGSADQTVKLWDLQTASCTRTLDFHSSEVLKVKWHPKDPSILLSSGLSDRSVVLSRADREKEFMKWDLGCTAETIQWHPTQMHMFVIGTSNGQVRVFDARQTGKPLYAFQAHQGECSVITFNHHIEGLMATGSNDKSISLWDVRNGHSLIVNRTLGVGEVFALEFNPNNPLLLAGGGSTAQELVWTIGEDIATCGFNIPAMDTGPSSSSSLEA